MNGRWGIAVGAVLLLTLSGCGGKESPAPTTTATTPPTSAATTKATVGPPPPPPPPRLPKFFGAQDATQPQPTFTMPPVVPGADWAHVQLSAVMPAGSWLFVYIPIPPGREAVPADLARQFRVDGVGHDGQASGRVVFAPFLVQDDHDGIVPETLVWQKEAVFDAAGASWHYEAAGDEVSPFGGLKYAGILAFVAATTEYQVELNITAPWPGNGTVGPEQVSWGRGFQATQLPAMAAAGTGGTDSSLEWSHDYGDGWLAMTAASTCYNPSPCAEAVGAEDWNVTFPGSTLWREFHRSATGGTSPSGLFGVMQSPPGALTVQGTLSGLSGPRTFAAFYAPVPRPVWPFAMADARFVA
ncbi:MAG: hypothetical protein ABR562_08090 [Thermoplasmatota archaeon]